MKKSNQTCIAVLLGFTLTPNVALSDELTGNIGVFSKYVLRGITTPGSESDRATLQGGLDYTHDNGFFAGWWASSLDYTYSKDTGPTSGNGFENDFYLGYSGSSNNFNYSAKITQFLYTDIDDSNLTELALSAGYGSFNVVANYLLNDGWWGNKGDTYWAISYETDLPKGFTFSALAGLYRYSDDDNAKLCYPDPSGCGITTKSSNFRHANLTLSHPIGDTGADMSFTYVIGGKNRSEGDQEDTMVLGISYNFDIK